MSTVGKRTIRRDCYSIFLLVFYTLIFTLYVQSEENSKDVNLNTDLSDSLNSLIPNELPKEHTVLPLEKTKPELENKNKAGEKVAPETQEELPPEPTVTVSQPADSVLVTESEVQENDTKSSDTSSSTVEAEGVKEDTDTLSSSGEMKQAQEEKIASEHGESAKAVQQLPEEQNLIEDKQDKPKRSKRKFKLFKRDNTAKGEFALLWKSISMQVTVNSFACGDVDNDGKAELVLITKDMVSLYYIEDQKLKLKEHIWKEKYKSLISVDVADINANGIPEIFITALNTDNRVSTAFILEYKNGDFKRIVKKMPYYFRVIHAANDTMLLGQKYNQHSPFSGDIFQFVSKKNKYYPETPFYTSGKLNVLGIDYKEKAFNETENFLAAYNKFDKIQLMKLSGRTIWSSSEDYGHSPHFLTSLQSSSRRPDRKYLPMRILIEDVNNDGLNELVAIQNTIVPIIDSFRRFLRTDIEVFAWNQIGFTTLVKTPQMKGHITDYMILDTDNDGKKELVAIHIENRGNVVVSKFFTSLLVYSFPS